MLEVENLEVSYGNIKALKGISFKIEKGRIITLVGSNGAGKSTVLKALSSLVKCKGGSIKFEGRDITKMPSDKVVGAGICQVPEGRRIFVKLNVAENLLMGAYLRRDQQMIEQDLEFVYTMFPRLKERARQMGGTLSGGEQQMLAIGRALMSKPRLLMLDEPSMGLAPLVVEEIFDRLRQLNEKGLTVLLVEQNANLALEISHYGYCIETGEIAFSGTGRELLSDDRVRKAYLGED